MLTPELRICGIGIDSKFNWPVPSHRQLGMRYAWELIPFWRFQSA